MSSLMIIVTIILVGIGSFFLGRISTENQYSTINSLGVNIKNPKTQNPTKSQFSYSSQNITSPISQNSGVYVASKNGKLYYRVGCGASNRILPQNQVFFDTETEAQSAGYEASNNCTP